MTAPYRPSIMPADPKALAAALDNEHAAIKRGLEQGWTSFTFTTLTAEPARLFDGLTVMADGTLWNPAAGGKGVYTYYASAWHKLG